MLYCDGVTDAMIKGLGQQKASVRYNILTNTMDVIFLYFLLPKYGISGYFISFLVTHIINFCLSLRRLLRITAQSIPYHIPLLTLSAAILSVWVCHFAKGAVLQSAAYVIVLLCLLFLLRILSKEDIRWLKGLICKK
jgi:O-antigen/teichoic acid export membrane protein